jgi:hypothetical protein
MVVVFLKVTRVTAEMLDNYRVSLRPVRSRAAVARAALTEYLKQQITAKSSRPLLTPRVGDSVGSMPGQGAEIRGK